MYCDSLSKPEGPPFTICSKSLQIRKVWLREVNSLPQSQVQIQLTSTAGELSRVGRIPALHRQAWELGKLPSGPVSPWRRRGDGRLILVATGAEGIAGSNLDMVHHSSEETKPITPICVPPFPAPRGLASVCGGCFGGAAGVPPSEDRCICLLSLPG